MKKNYLYLVPVVIGIMALTSPVLISTGIGIPDVQAVYGGRINAITGYQKTADTTRIFVTTESANSAFYADYFTQPSGTPIITAFKKVPGMDDTKGYGSGISKIAVQATAGNFYFISNGNLYQTNPSSSTTNEILTGGVNAVLIKDDYVFAEQSGQLIFGTLDASGVFTLGTGAPIAIPAAFESKYIINPVNGKVLIFSSGFFPELYSSSDSYNAFSGSTTFSAISTTLSSPSVNWTAFGVAPDGRYFIGGTDNSTKFIAYSDDDGATYTEYNTGISGVSGSNFDFAGSSLNYNVYFSSIYSTNKGISGSWLNFGSASAYTHPNDGAVFTDPNNNAIVYMTTDQGLGVSLNNGADIVSGDEGIEAVQVKDMEMTADKNTAWIASKSGIRKATNYQTTPTFTNAIFPMNDGSPYFSVGMPPSDSNTCYAGNLRVYKTTDSGANWSRVFTPENAPYNYSGVVQVNAITVCPYDENILMAGYELLGTVKGGLFYSLDAGATWSQQLLHVASGVNDVDVNDIVFTQEGADIVAYVGVDYDLSSPTGRSVYKLIKNGSSWTVSRDMDSATTSTSTTIVATIKDLSFDSSTSTLYAVGTDAGTNHPVVYSKALTGTALWTPFTVSGFDTSAGQIGKAITNSTDFLYVAVNNFVYYFEFGGTTWAKYDYPVGTEINFLFYDALLVGTGTGLYAQSDPAVTLGVDEYFNNINGSLKVYPNPTHQGEAMQIKYDLKRGGEVQIAIYDRLGREIVSTSKAYKSEGTYELDLAPKKIKTGLYFVTVKLNNTVILSKKVLVQ